MDVDEEGEPRMASSFPVGRWAVDGGDVCGGTGFRGGGGEGRIRGSTCICFWKEGILFQTLGLLMAESRSYSLAPGH